MAQGLTWICFYSAHGTCMGRARLQLRRALSWAWGRAMSYRVSWALTGKGKSRHTGRTGRRHRRRREGVRANRSRQLWGRNREGEEGGRETKKTWHSRWPGAVPPCQSVVVDKCVAVHLRLCPNFPRPLSSYTPIVLPSLHASSLPSSTTRCSAGE